MLRGLNGFFLKTYFLFLFYLVIFIFNLFIIFLLFNSKFLTSAQVTKTKEETAQQSKQPTDLKTKRKRKTQAQNTFQPTIINTKTFSKTKRKTSDPTKKYNLIMSQEEGVLHGAICSNREGLWVAVVDQWWWWEELFSFSFFFSLNIYFRMHG